MSNAAIKNKEIKKLVSKKGKSAMIQLSHQSNAVPNSAVAASSMHTINTTSNSQAVSVRDKSSGPQHNL